MRRDFGDIKVGDSAHCIETLTRDYLIKYAELSGDYNPIHLQSSYSNLVFHKKKCIAHGLFGLGLISRIIGTDLPGEGSVFLNEKIDYLNPIYEGDIVKATVTVISIIENKKLVELEVLCTNQIGKILMKGTVLVKMIEIKINDALKLRKINKSDLEMIMNWRMLPEVTKYMYSDPVLTIEKQEQWYNKCENDNSIKQWIITFDNNDIGYLSISNIDYDSRKCDWAYYIADTSFRGKGIAKTLECNIYDYVFFDLGLNKLCCEVFMFNESVIKLHEKFGSEVEGVRKEHIIKGGVHHDVAVMGILRSKWNEIKDNYQYDIITIE